MALGKIVMKIKLGNFLSAERHSAHGKYLWNKKEQGPVQMDGERNVSWSFWTPEHMGVPARSPHGGCSFPFTLSCTSLHWVFIVLLDNILYNKSVKKKKAILRFQSTN